MLRVKIFTMCLLISFRVAPPALGLSYDCHSANEVKLMGIDNTDWNLTHYSLVTRYGDIDPGQHWLRYCLVAWWYQAITWTNVDTSSMVISGLHVRAISQEVLIKFMSNMMGSELTLLKLLPPLPGANELTKIKHTILSTMCIIWG